MQEEHKRRFARWLAVAVQRSSRPIVILSMSRKTFGQGLKTVDGKTMQRLKPSPHPLSVSTAAAVVVGLGWETICKGLINFGEFKKQRPLNQRTDDNGSSSRRRQNHETAIFECDVEE